MLAGVSTAFYTGVENTVLDHLEALVKEEAALSFVIQHSGKFNISFFSILAKTEIQDH